MARQLREDGNEARFVDRCYERCSRGLYPKLEREQLACAMEIVEGLVIKTWILYAVAPSQGEQARRALGLELQIVERGLRL